MKPYYYIFRVGGFHPRIKHPTLELAHGLAMCQRQEAELNRLTAALEGLQNGPQGRGNAKCAGTDASEKTP